MIDSCCFDAAVAFFIFCCCCCGDGDGLRLQILVEKVGDCVNNVHNIFQRGKKREERMKEERQNNVMSGKKSVLFASFVSMAIYLLNGRNSLF